MRSGIVFYALACRRSSWRALRSGYKITRNQKSSHNSAGMWSVPPSVQVYHELVVLERIHQVPEFCPGASLEALTRPPLAFH